MAHCAFESTDLEGAESDDVGIPPRAFCFAKPKFRDAYYVEFEPHQTTGPCPCYITGGDIVRVVNSLRDSLTWPPRSAWNIAILRPNVRWT